MGGTRRVAVITVVLLLAACDSGGSTAATPTTTRSGPVTSLGRGRVSLELRLDRGSAAPGARVPGTVTVDNRTGEPIDVVMCGSPFQVWLGRRGHWPDPAWTLCATPLTIAEGRTGFPVALVAAYAGCSRNGSPPCGTSPAPTGPPPLPVGRYLVRLFQAPRIGARPPDIPFTVTAAKG